MSAAEISADYNLSLAAVYAALAYYFDNKLEMDLWWTPTHYGPTEADVATVLKDNLEETGMGYGPEVDMIRTAAEMGLLTTPYAFNPDEAEQMADAGADIVVAHMGLTTKGSIGASTALSLEESVERVQAICADIAKHGDVPYRPLTFHIPQKMAHQFPRVKQSGQKGRS